MGTQIRTICLNLDLRLDNWLTNILPKWKAIGIHPESFICGSSNLDYQYNHQDEQIIPQKYSNSINYPTWFARPNAYNAWKCHRKIFEIAYFSGDNALLLLEDDAIPEDDFVDIYEKCKDYLNNNPIDMLYFGCYSNGNLIDIGHKYIKRMNGGGGFHGVLLNRNIMKQLLAFAPLGPYDWMTQEYIHPYHKCYAITPCIISQESGYSYVENNTLVKPDRNVK